MMCAAFDWLIEFSLYCLVNWWNWGVLVWVFQEINRYSIQLGQVFFWLKIKNKTDSCLFHHQITHIHTNTKHILSIAAPPHCSNLFYFFASNYILRRMNSIFDSSDFESFLHNFLVFNWFFWILLFRFLSVVAYHFLFSLKMFSHKMWLEKLFHIWKTWKMTNTITTMTTTTTINDIDNTIH